MASYTWKPGDKSNFWPISNWLKHLKYLKKNQQYTVLKFMPLLIVSIVQSYYMLAHYYENHWQWISSNWLLDSNMAMCLLVIWTQRCTYLFFHLQYRFTLHVKLLMNRKKYFIATHCYFCPCSPLCLTGQKEHFDSSGHDNQSLKSVLDLFIFLTRFLSQYGKKMRWYKIVVLAL